MNVLVFRGDTRIHVDHTFHVVTYLLLMAGSAMLIVGRVAHWQALSTL